MHDVSWTDDVFRILTDLTGSPSHALVAYCAIIAEALLLALTPLVVLMLFSRVASAQRQMGQLGQEMKKLATAMDDTRARMLLDLRELRAQLHHEAAARAPFPRAAGAPPGVPGAVGAPVAPGIGAVAPGMGAPGGPQGAGSGRPATADRPPSAAPDGESLAGTGLEATADAGAAAGPGQGTSGQEPMTLDALLAAAAAGPEPSVGGADAGGPGGSVAPAGEVAYRYCPTCRAIQMVKFSRCQSCGYHFL